MADLTREMPEDCCSPELQSTCCKPSAKADCCDRGEDCGCQAGEHDADASPAVRPLRAA